MENGKMIGSMIGLVKLTPEGADGLKAAGVRPVRIRGGTPFERMTYGGTHIVYEKTPPEVPSGVATGLEIPIETNHVASPTQP